jgi:hypothetical protein
MKTPAAERWFDDSRQPPSEEGLRRYPPDGLYDHEVPCTCQAECPPTCKGQCGCEACAAAYGDVAFDMGLQ